MKELIVAFVLFLCSYYIDTNDVDDDDDDDVVPNPASKRRSLFSIYKEPEL